MIMILFLIKYTFIHSQHRRVKIFSPDSSNWTNSVMNIGESVESVEELIL